MICVVVAPGLPQPVSWVAFTARTAWIHHLLRPPVTAPPHLPLGTQNEVPVTAYIRLSRSKRGRGSYDSFSVGAGRSICCTATPARLVPPDKYVPLLFISFLRVIFGGRIKFLPEYFSSVGALAGFPHARSLPPSVRFWQFPKGSCQADSASISGFAAFQATGK